MSITVHILYTGKNGSAAAFAREMIDRGIVGAVRAEPGNEAYDYYLPLEQSDDGNRLLLIDRWSDQGALDAHHRSPMMKEIADLRTKYHLRMQVRRFTEL